MITMYFSYMFGLRINWFSYVLELVTLLLKFWNLDLSFLGNKLRDDPIYSVNGKMGYYSKLLNQSLARAWVERTCCPSFRQFLSSIVYATLLLPSYGFFPYKYSFIC